MLDKYSMFHGWPLNNWDSFMCVYSKCYKFNPAKHTLQLYEKGLKVSAEVTRDMKAQISNLLSLLWVRLKKRACGIKE